MADLNNLIVDQFYRTTVAVTLDAVGEPKTILVTDASGFPDIAAPKYFYLTLVTGNVAEVVKVINITGNTITTEASISFQFPVGARAEHWFTAQAFQDVSDYLTNLAVSSYPGVSNPTIVADPTIRVGVIGSANIGLDAVNESHIGDQQVREEHIANGAVTPLKFGDDSVTEPKIAPGAVINEKLVNNDVELTKLKWVSGDRAVLGNLSDALAPVEEVIVHSDINMGLDVPEYENYLATERSIKQHVAQEINDFREALNSTFETEYVVPTSGTHGTTLSKTTLGSLTFNISEFVGPGLTALDIRAVYVAHYSKVFMRSVGSTYAGQVSGSYPDGTPHLLSKSVTGLDEDSIGDGVVSSANGVTRIPVNRGQLDITLTNAGTSNYASFEIIGVEQRVPLP